MRRTRWRRRKGDGLAQKQTWTESEHACVLNDTESYKN